MRKIINEYIGNENGLLLIDIPTGMGKTNDVLEVMVDKLADINENSRPIFFITNLTKNLPINEFCEKAAERGLSEEFDKYVLVLEAMTTMVRKRLLDLEDQIPEEITQDKAYQDLRSHLKFLKNNEESSIDTSVFNDQIGNLEYNFRKFLMTKLDELGDVKVKLETLENDSKWQWVDKLYPSVFTSKRKIFFLSMDKFFLANPTLVEPNYQFINKKEWEKAIIFIDEFDATKESIINQLIKNSEKNAVNLIQLFCSVHHFLQYGEWQKSILDEKAENIVANMKDMFGELFEQYCKYSFKTEDTLDARQYRNFLFNDGQYLQIKENKLYYYVDEQSKVNWITTNNDNGQNKSLTEVFGKLNGAIEYFVRGMAYITSVYNKSEANSRNLTYSNCLHSILKVMHLDNQSNEYLFNRILSLRTEGKVKNSLKSQSLAVRNLYSTGFKLYSLFDGDDNALNTDIMFYQVPYFPEYFLYELCSKSLVIGISATATVPSVLNNYDLNYLQMMLKDKFYQLKDYHHEHLKEKSNQLIQGYPQVKMELKKVVNQPLEYVLGDFFDDKAITSYIADFVGAIDAFYLERLTKMLSAMFDFLTDSSVQSMLIFSNQLINNHSKPNIHLFKRAVQLLNQQYFEHSYDVDSLFVTLNSQNFEKQKTQLLEKLSKGEKIVIFTSYKTVGVGQNLQYDIPENTPVIQVNNRKSKSKDIDCIYIDLPTHLIARKYKDTQSMETIYRGIFQMEYLSARGEISPAQCKYFISQYFTDGNIHLDTDKTRSMNNKAIAIIQQAVGRICRTSNKNAVIKLYIDDKVFQTCDFSDFKNKINNPEFQKIIETSYKNHSFEKGEVDSLQNQAVNHTLRFKNKLYHFVYNNKQWTSEQVAYWQAMRQHLLKYPTLSTEAFLELEDNYQSFYIQMPTPRNSYTYTQEKDFSYLQIYFGIQGKSNVSAEDVKLNKIQQITELSNYFEQQGYALSFERQEYMLSPVAYQNIYKGALGETIGKKVLETHLDIQLEEMPAEYYELFDYHIQNKVYVDFKYWKESNKQRAKEYLERIHEKLMRVGGKRAIIINIFANRAYNYSTSYQNQIIEIPYLFHKKQLDAITLKQLEDFIKETIASDDNSN